MNRFNFARFDGRFLRQVRDEDENTTFVPFRATEVINYSYDPQGLPFSILSYYVDIQDDEALSVEWQQYLAGAKPISPLAIATSNLIAPPGVDPAALGNTNGIVIASIGSNTGVTLSGGAAPAPVPVLVAPTASLQQVVSLSTSAAAPQPVVDPAAAASTPDSATQPVPGNPTAVYASVSGTLSSAVQPPPVLATAPTDTPAGPLKPEDVPSAVVTDYDQYWKKVPCAGVCVVAVWCVDFTSLPCLCVCV